jgi:hypothetical protein
MLTAVLLVGQTAPAGKDCACQKGVSGRVFAQPAVVAEGPRLAPWRNAASGGSWIDNRPVLSKIRNFFRDDDDMTIVGQPEMVQPVQTAQPERSRLLFRNTGSSGATAHPSPLPTFVEPRVGERIGGPVSTPRPVAPAEVRPAPAGQDLPKITVEPISFRAAGTKAKGQPANETGAASEGNVPSEPGVVADRLVSSETAPRNLGAIQERFVNKVGQPGDYSWITGQLEIKNGVYILHYATPDTIDRFGGSIVVQPQTDPRNLRNGDLVSAHGTVAQERGRPVYRARSVDFIER